MMRRLSFALLVLASFGAAANPASGATLRASLQRDINEYLASRTKGEHLSAISLSVSLHGQARSINVTAGRAQYGRGVSVTPDSLFQTGSQTKGFTAAAVLQLEAEGKLTIDQTVGKWLLQYSAWKNVSIRRLLNMTSGIPSYDTAPAWLAAYAKNPKRTFSIPELIAYVDPKRNPHAPPPTKGWNYSNTNYVLAQLIIERATGKSYATEIERRFFKPLGLNHTYYADTHFSPDVLARTVSGYFSSRDADVGPLAPLLDTDVHANSPSWLRAAGGTISTPDDLARWARALYTGPMLAAKQRAELLQIVSLKTGKPIARTSQADPLGFGLGIVQLTDPNIKTTIWCYEGDAMGYRMVYFYLPRYDAVFALALNSNPGGRENHARKLEVSIYKTLLAAGALTSS